MLVPGIHSDSKIKLQEEVCTRNKSLSDWQTFGIPFCQSLSVLFDFGGIQESCLGFFFVGTEEKKQSDSSVCYWPHQQWTQKVR